MGCCASRTAASNNNDEPSARQQASTNSSLPHDSSRAAINQPSNSSSVQASRRASSHSPLRPNAPIRPPSPVPTSPTTSAGKTVPWTRKRLETEREAFFDTRVTGSAEVWSALKLACECLRRGDLSQAQGILDAVGVNVPDGRVAVGKKESRSGRGRGKRTGGVFDETGVGYDIPGWVVADPEDLIDDEGEEGGEKDGVAAAERAKGKAEDVGELVSLKARLSDRSSDLTLRVGMGQTAAAVCEQIQEKIGPKKLRLMYLGRVWMESKTLEDLGYREGDVVSAFVL